MMWIEKSNVSKVTAMRIFYLFVQFVKRNVLCHKWLYRFN